MVNGVSCFHLGWFVANLNEQSIAQNLFSSHMISLVCIARGLLRLSNNFASVVRFRVSLHRFGTWNPKLHPHPIC